MEDVVHRVRVRIDFLLNSFSPINQFLSPEVLDIIPSFVVRDRDLLATHVCRRRRDTSFLTLLSGQVSVHFRIRE